MVLPPRFQPNGAATFRAITCLRVSLTEFEFGLARLLGHIKDLVCHVALKTNKIGMFAHKCPHPKSVDKLRLYAVPSILQTTRASTGPSRPRLENTASGVVILQFIGLPRLLPTMEQSTERSEAADPEREIVL